MGATLDLFEYANDGAAQAAYVSSDTGGSGYSLDLCNNGTAISNGYWGVQYPAYAFDNNLNVNWSSPHLNGGVSGVDWIGYDFGSGVTPTVERFTLKQNADIQNSISSVIIEYSDNGSNWTPLETVTIIEDAAVNTYTLIQTSSAHRYWRVMANDNTSAGSTWTVFEIEMMTKLPNLQCYSESTIKEQGSYSLKGVAMITGSLNDNLTKSGLSIDLTGATAITFDLRASRTGAHIKIGIHDSGGQTTEKTHTIVDANTWEQVTWDISGVSDVNKDDIDSIIITILNADATNTFYIDDMIATANYIKNVSETINLTETIVKASTRPFSETLTMTDPSIVKAVGKNVAETITLTEAYARKWTLVRVFSETITLTEVIIKAMTRLFSDTVTLIDSAIKGMGRAFAETITLTEAWVRGITRPFAETITLTETAGKAIAWIIDESIVLTDTMAKVWNKVLTFTETMTFTDVFTKSLRWVRKQFDPSTWNRSSHDASTWTDDDKEDTEWQTKY